jgi:hypothetical protein
MSFNDFVKVQECRKTLRDYKCGDFDEVVCLTKLAKLFKELGDSE